MLTCSCAHESMNIQLSTPVRNPIDSIDESRGINREITAELRVSSTEYPYLTPITHAHARQQPALLTRESGERGGERLNRGGYCICLTESCQSRLQVSSVTTQNAHECGAESHDSHPQPMHREGQRSNDVSHRADGDGTLVSGLPACLGPS